MYLGMWGGIPFQSGIRVDSKQIPLGYLGMIR